jgi:pimeloyl-ACP methyl ester carboxylesterase
MILGIRALPASFFVIACGLGLAQSSTKNVPSRDYITARIADLRKINTPEGIEALETVDIDGSKQWISIRGLNRENPVLLMIHGGPGSPMLPLSWAYQAPWEDFFTVVNWDQRGSGKSYNSDRLEDLQKTLSPQRVFQDAEAITAYLRKRLNKDKIFAMGFSWGSDVGVHLAKKKPEWLYAYIGVGQMSGGDGEKFLYEHLLELARKTKNEEAIRELEGIAPYPLPYDRRKMTVVRNWALKFDGGWYGRKNLDLFYALQDWAPEYTQADVDAQGAVYRLAATNIVGQIPTEDLRSLGPKFEVPVILLMGRFDLHTPYVRAKEYFDWIQAPKKKFVTFERSSHFMMFEEPGRFLMTLVDDVLPLAGPAPQFKPLQ